MKLQHLPIRRRLHHEPVHDQVHDNSSVSNITYFGSALTTESIQTQS